MKAIVSAKIKINEMTTNKAFSYTTNEDGKFKIISSSLNLGNIIISHDDYFEQDAEYGPNK